LLLPRVIVADSSVPVGAQRTPHDRFESRRFASPDDIRANAPLDLSQVAWNCREDLRWYWSTHSAVPIHALMRRRLGASSVVAEFPSALISLPSGLTRK
jgi:hypothetical protein